MSRYHTPKIIREEDTYHQRMQNFVRFVLAREQIRVRKESGQARPWTDDAIFDNYHFCNVRRADDRVTKWIGEWLPKSPRTRWFACAVARWFNEPETLKQLPSLKSGWDPSGTREVLKNIAASGKNIFRASYIINGALQNKGPNKYDTVIDSVLTPLWVTPPKIVRDRCEDSWKALLRYPGQGPFMAGQIVADWQTFGVIQGVDAATWAPLGPGSRKGLAYLLGPGPKLTQERGVEEMRKCAVVLDKFIPEQLPPLTLHDVQNCLCEFSKYVRGWSKTKYTPYEDDGRQGVLF